MELVVVGVHDPGNAAGRVLAAVGRNHHGTGQIAEVVVGCFRGWLDRGDGDGGRVGRRVGGHNVRPGIAVVARDPVKRAMVVGRGAQGPVDQHRRGGYPGAGVVNRVQDVVVIDVELSQVVAVEQVDRAFLAGGHDQVRMAGDAGRVGQHQGRAGAEILVGVVERVDVVGCEVIDDFQAPAIGILVGRGGGRVGLDLDQGFVIVIVGGEAVGIEGRRAAARVAVAGFKVEGGLPIERFRPDRRSGRRRRPRCLPRRHWGRCTGPRKEPSPALTG